MAMGEETESSCTRISLALGECGSSFNLENAVCNHGFFMMAPNLWIPSSKTLQRPFRLTDDSSVLVSISHPPYRTSSLILQLHDVHHNISSTDQQLILGQVARMLRISKKDETAVKEFQNVHPEAKKRGFGRLFRSPTLFEDFIKSILLCNCTWERTLNMSEALCLLQHGRYKKGLKRKRGSTNNLKKRSKAQYLGNFPSPSELASVDEKFLNRHCNLGYRASHIIRFASSVYSGRLKLTQFEEGICDIESYTKLSNTLMRVKGFGPFVRANVFMCIGYYKEIPVDTETIRHISHMHKRKDCNKMTVGTIVEQIYGKYAPFQCLAYWLELVEYYENNFGRLSELPQSRYRTVTGSINHKLGEKEKEEEKD